MVRMYSKLHTLDNHVVSIVEVKLLCARTPQDMRRSTLHKCSFMLKRALQAEAIYCFRFDVPAAPSQCFHRQRSITIQARRRGGETLSKPCENSAEWLSKRVHGGAKRCPSPVQAPHFSVKRPNRIAKTPTFRVQASAPSTLVIEKEKIRMERTRGVGSGRWKLGFKVLPRSLYHIGGYVS